MTPKRKIIVTLPAYRAEKTLGKTVAAIPEGAADHLILVDDASPDHTAEIARGLGIDVVVHPQNRGYGGNQKTCYVEALTAGADVVVLLHPDYQYDPAAVPLLTAPILAGSADMTFGSRFSGLSDPLGGGMPRYRYIGNRLSTTIENLVLGSRFTEMHSGMRAYTRRCLLTLPFLHYSDDFGFDSQFLIDAVTLGLRVVEVPIPTRYTEESSSIGVGRSFRYVGTSIRYCIGQTVRRGKRGRRSLVAAANATGCVDLAAAPVGAVLGTGTADWLLDVIGGYPVRGQRLAARGLDQRVVDAMSGRGWEILRGSYEAADVVALTDASSLEHVRANVDAEGLLAVFINAKSPKNGAAIGAYFRSAGFRVVGCEDAPRTVGNVQLITARPA